MGRQTMTELSEAYGEMRRRRGLAASTLASEAGVIRKLCAWWDRTRRAPGSLGDGEMEEFLFGEDGLADQLGAVSSFNTQVNQLRVFVDWLVRRRVLSPAVRDVMTTVKYDRGDYLRLELPTLLTMIDRADDPWERFVLALSLHTLGREGELLSRQWCHVHLDTGVIDWKRNKVSKTVNGYDRLPITQDLDTEIRRWMLYYQEQAGPLSPEWYLIPRRDGHADAWRWEPGRPRHQIGTVIQRYASAMAPGIELKGQGGHIMRRSSARALYERLVEVGEADPLRVVQAMLGHSSVTTTELYLGVRKDREKRDSALRGQSLLSISTEDVIELKRVV